MDIRSTLAVGLLGLAAVLIAAPREAAADADHPRVRRHHARVHAAYHRHKDFFEQHPRAARHVRRHHRRAHAWYRHHRRGSDAKHPE